MEQTIKNKDEEGLAAQAYIGADEPSLTESIDKLFGGSSEEKPAKAAVIDSDAPEGESGADAQDEAAASQDQSSGGSEEQKPGEHKPAEEKPSEEDDIEIEAEGQFGSAEAQEEEEEVKSFDESAFDKETAAIVKSLEEKGHPGDVYKDLRQKLKDAQKQLETKQVPEDVQEQLETLKAKAEEADALRERLEEVSSVSAKVRVEASDAFRKEVLAPAQDILLATKELAESYGIDQDSLNALIVEKDRKVRNQLIESHLSDFSEMDRQDVYSMIRKYGEIETKRSEMLQNAEAELAAKKAEREESSTKEAEERKKQFRTIQDSVWGKYSEKIPGALDETGNLSKEFASLKKKALLINPSAYDARDEAYTAFTGTVFPELVKRLIKQDRKIKELEAAEENETRGKPKATPATGAKPAKGSGKSDEDGLLAAIEKSFRK